jgi:hypothetical protein
MGSRMATLTKAALLGAAVLLPVACKKTADNTLNYKSALNTYYSKQPVCLWDSPQRFPVEVSTSDSDKTAGYDALYNQGLLNRTTAEKTKLLILSKQVTHYDLSDKGRSAWTPSAGDPSTGNFCYGHRSVTNLDSSTPNNGEPGATTTVTYHWTLDGVAGWAKDAGVGNSFPDVRAEIAGGSDSATLSDTANGWQVDKPSLDHKTAAGPVDGQIVH